VNLLIAFDGRKDYRVVYEEIQVAKKKGEVILPSH
jgi:hypothetical protein